MEATFQAQTWGAGWCPEEFQMPCVAQDWAQLEAQGPECEDTQDVAQEPGLRARRARGRQAGSARWWTRPEVRLLCPLTKFPIALLPYPPFKLRVDPQRSTPHRLVDGKFLAMHVIATGRFVACGRELLPTDMRALDDYVQWCKLGPYRPGRALALAEEASAPFATRRAEAARELELFRVAAKAELGKLRRIQENRLMQLKRSAAPRQQRGSCASSTASTRASTSDSSDSPRDTSHKTSLLTTCV